MRGTGPNEHYCTIAQVSGIYGRGAAETIVENCGNTLILRCSASERGGTSEFASKLIGQREVVHTVSSKTHQPNKWMATTTTSESLRIEPAVLASEIERLPNLVGYLKLASQPDWQMIRLTPMAQAAPVRPRKPNAVSASPTVMSPATTAPSAAPPESANKPRSRRAAKSDPRRGPAPPQGNSGESISPGLASRGAIQSSAREAE